MSQFLKETLAEPLKPTGPPPPSPSSSFHFEYGYAKLPDQFPDLDDIELPVVRNIGIKACIEELAIIFNCNDYKFNLLHFWFLDVVTDCIWMTQDKFSFPVDVQKKVLAWLLFAIDLIRDPSKSLSRKEFLDVFRETVCVAADLIEEGCYDVPIPLKMVSVPNKTADSMQSELVSFEEIQTNKSKDTISEKTISNEILSYIELKNQQETDVHLLKKERCCCSETTDFSSVTEKSSYESISTKESSKVAASSIHDFYRADFNTPPRFKSTITLASMNNYSTEEYKVQEEEDRILLELVETSTRESLKDPSAKKVYVVFRRPSYSSISTENKVASIIDKKSEEKLEETTTDKKKPLKDTKAKKKTKQEVVEKVEEILPDSNKPETSESAKIKNNMEALKVYKLWEQRNKDLADSKIGLESWQINGENEDELPEIIYKETENDIDSDLNEERLDEEILEILNKDLYNMNEKEYLSFGILWSIIDFIYSYFSDTFQYSLVKIALTAPPNIITQKINETWLCPKLLKEDMTKYVKDIKDKYKRIPIKKKKEKDQKKKEKPSKSKKDKPTKDKTKKVKPAKLSKAEKAALKEAEKLRKRLEKEEQERILLEEMNKKFLFPLQDAAPDDEFFKSKFDNYKKVKVKGKKK